MTQNTAKQTISSTQQVLGNTTEYHTDKENPKPKTPYQPQHDQERAYQALLNRACVTTSFRKKQKQNATLEKTAKMYWQANFQVNQQ